MSKSVLSALLLVLAALAWPATVAPAAAAAPTACGDLEAIAHRGFHPNRVDENSLDSFRFAAELGYSVETDVWSDLDGQLWIFHDRDVERATGAVGYIDEMTTEQVRALRYLKAGTPLVTVEEAVELLNDYPATPVYFEFKEASIIAPLAQLVIDAGLTSHTWFVSFPDQTHLAFPDIQLLLKFPDPLPDPASLADRGISIVQLNESELTEATVDSYHDADVEVQNQTANTSAGWDVTINSGADGQLTDFPDELRAHCDGVDPPPFVTGLDPGAALATAPFVIYGINLSDTASVSFGDVPAPSFTVDSPTQITADVPLGAPEVGQVTISTPDGTTRSLDSYALVRSTPTISASVSPAPGASGWFTAPVTVTFTCAGDVVPLASCSAPTQLTSSGKGQSAAGTVLALDGGAGTASVAGLDVDLEAPTVKIKGVKKGRTYLRPPKPRCKAGDEVSGVSSCDLDVRKRKDRVIVTATATDAAGNSSTTKTRYKVAPKRPAAAGLPEA